MIESILSAATFLNKINYTADKKGSIFLHGVSSNLKDMITVHELYKEKRPVIYILKDDVSAKETYLNLSDILSEKDILYYPSKPITHEFIDSHSMELTNKRVNVIKNAVMGSKKIIVTSINAAIEKGLFWGKDSIITKKTEDILDIDEFIEILNKFGYAREYEVTGQGAYSVKGGIVDVFIMGDDVPVRIEFFDDEIDSIRTFDKNTGKSIEKINKFTLVPAKTSLLDYDEINKLNKKVRAKLEKAITQNEDEEIDKNYRELYEKIVDNTNDTTKYIFYASKQTKSLIDLYKEPLIIFDDYSIIKKTYNRFFKENKEELKDLAEHGKILDIQVNNHFKFAEAEERFINLDSLIYFDLSMASNNLFCKDIVEVKSSDNINYVKNINYLIDNIVTYLKEDYKVIITYKNEKEKKNLSEFLSNYNIDYTYIVKEGHVALVKSNIRSGVNILSEKLFILSYNDVLIKKEAKKKRTKKDKHNEKAFFSEITKGDYVVHETYGIGRYLGMVNMEAGGLYNDYLEIEFAGNDKLYVIANKMNLVSKYIGSSDAPPKLNKLGSQVWENTKNKTRKAVKELAKEYITLYAKRREIKGFAFSSDTPWQKEFEDNFGYELTEDQERCVREVKEDMEKPYPMDRLICGDVGFGKTEVAARAIFKAVMDGKQCAILVPTTILAMQHYNTFVERFKDFPVKIEMLSRFKTKKEENRIIDKLERGKVDIVIGTHKLLSDNVNFKDLGLLVVDEEQRFGVAHKDKLKLLKENVDTLTLSATPIPRTLNMSLIGIRDLSTIESPPKEREETETYVIEYDDYIIKDAINRELSRGGQVFFVYNSVKNAEKTCLKLRKLIPGLKVEFANGQMPERELEKTMFRFLNKEFDVLVCTAIVENGLNILNANTMIIKEGNNLGLSQLYQLRGRVGRSNKNAYCYVTYEKDKALNEVAMKRLKAINEFTKFGSGFQIAIRDLQIRGSGNLLGANQSGHFTNVGYELYTKMLQEALKESKGEAQKEPVETTINIKINAYIDKKYIEDEKQRIITYKEIAIIETEADKDEMVENLIDIYGDIRKETLNLMDISLLRNKASKKDILSINVNEENREIYFDFDKEKEIDMDEINKLYEMFKGKFIKNSKFIRICFPYKKTRNVHQSIMKLIDKIIDKIA
ncbi:transcription-repair coupling factor [Anaerofustis stercorihominis]|uniref:Transcription-repair-coupling factor n=1 Tax=Anaerofustis stercorihominis TaxID=214853 RepID=A0A3E3DWX7_9FIRM|nr:transcription-repair coupling factor [Anaerofustis stercorihominis]RGD73208.1 transcription-repair coupling factor [Anaerofustis stercorihominis]